MSERFVSPGVYTEERDFSYYAANLGESSLGLIGETKKGPAFLPTLIKNMSEFTSVFGGLDNTKYVPYCAKNYFKYASSAYVVRVLGEESVHASSETVIYLVASGTSAADSFVFASLVAPAGTKANIQTGISLSGGSQFGFTATTIFSGNVNVDSLNNPSNIASLFPRTYTGSSNLTLLSVFPSALAAYKTYSAYTGTVANSAYDLSSYAGSRTPLIMSDVVSGGSGTGLFTIYTVADGISSNGDIKVAIENIDTTARTFDVVVRSYADTDAIPVYLERFSKCSLNPSATTYLPRMIGDSRDDTGSYNRISKYIYVTLEPGDLSVRVPAGYAPFRVPMAVASIPLPNIPCRTSYDASIATSKQWLGPNYATADADAFMKNYLSQWDLDETTYAALAKGFHCDSTASSASTYTVGSSALTAYTKAQRKFLVPVFGGRDGWPRTASTRDFLGSAPTAAQLATWKSAIDLLSNTEQYDLNLLAVPGCSIDSSIGAYAIAMAEDRADTFYVGDFPSTQSTATGAAAIPASIDSNYAATYWPYVKIYDSENSAYATIPPTPQVLEAMAYTDTVSYPWFAPAGMNRGLITDAVNVEYKLSIADRDILYEGKVNPIAFFPGQGIAIWGQKTLQTRTTSLDRINVRRMLLYVRKVIATATKYLVFEQNDEKTWDRFKAMVQPVLDLVKIKQGLYDFRVVMDASTNTPDVIDRNEMKGAIYLKPTKTAEVITLTFNILSSGAVFEE